MHVANSAAQLIRTHHRVAVAAIHDPVRIAGFRVSRNFTDVMLADEVIKGIGGGFFVGRVIIDCLSQNAQVRLQRRFLRPFV